MDNIDIKYLTKAFIIRYLKRVSLKENCNDDEIKDQINTLKDVWDIYDESIINDTILPDENIILPIKTDKNASENIKNKGNIAFREGDIDKSILLYTEAINNDSQNPISYSNRSAAHAMKNEYEESIKDAEVAITLDPKDPKPYNRMGLALFKLNRYSDSIEIYKRGLRLCPNNASLVNGLNHVVEFCNQQKIEINDNSSIDERIVKLLDLARAHPETLETLVKNIGPDFQTNILSEPKLVLKHPIIAQILEEMSK